MAGLLSGLEQFGLSNLESMDLFEAPKKEGEGEGGEQGTHTVQEQDFLFDKSFTCPLCDREFKARTVKIGKAKLAGSDLDLRPRYEQIDLLKYDVIMCPSCGYASLSRFFKYLTSPQAKNIQKAISANFKPQKETAETYTYEEALERYKMALANAIVKQTKASEKAYICLKTAWLLRGQAEHLDPEEEGYEEKKKKCQEEEEEFLRNALEGFLAARQTESFPMCGMDEPTVDFLISVTAMRFEQYDVASRLITGLITSKTANPRMKDKARDVKEMLMKKIKEKNAAAQKIAAVGGQMRELPIHIELEPRSGKTLYEQIYEYIREEIRQGNLLQDERLPSARFLSEYLQVSRTTVDMAYGALVAEGYLVARPKRGYFVGDVRELYNTGMADQQDRTEPLQKGKSPGLRYDFSPNAIDMSQFPYATWKKITKNILVDARSHMFALGEPQGDMELRRTICRYLHGSRGVNCDPEQIIVGAGNDFLLLLLEKILGRHIHVAMENPTYIRAYKIFRSFAYPISLIPLDDRGIRVDRLEESGAKLAYVMPSRQYPTGISMPIGRRMEAPRWAQGERERYLIEDDYDSEFRYKGKPLPSLQASDRMGRVIYIGTFSKAIAPAIRVSYMVLPYPLLERYRRECGFFSSTVSRIDQTILNEFISEGYFERYLNKMRKLYRTKHDLLLGELRELLQFFSVSGENAGLHVVLTDKRGRGEAALEQAAADADVKVYGMGSFYMEERAGQGAESRMKSRPATMILGYGGLAPEQITEGIERLKGCWM